MPILWACSTRPATLLTLTTQPTSIPKSFPVIPSPATSGGTFSSQWPLSLSVSNQALIQLSCFAETPTTHLGTFTRSWPDRLLLSLLGRDRLMGYRSFGSSFCSPNFCTSPRRVAWTIYNVSIVSIKCASWSHMSICSLTREEAIKENHQRSRDDERHPSSPPTCTPSSQLQSAPPKPPHSHTCQTIIMSLPFLFRHPLSRTTLPISPRLATISASSRSFASPPPPNAANAPPLPHLASSKADIPEGLSGAAPATILPSTGAVAGAAETKGLGETVEKKGRMKWLLLTGLLG
jgi:hypothetical protein